MTFDKAMIHTLEKRIDKLEIEVGRLREAIKTLEQGPGPGIEQKPVLDKIRAEIEELDGIYVIGDYGIYEENIPMDDLFYSHKHVRLCDALQIIDRYNAEFDGIGDE